MVTLNRFRIFVDKLKLIKIMSNLVNDELAENLYEMFIEAGYTEKEAERAVLEAMDARGI